MSNAVAKAVASVAMSIAIAVAAYKTESAYSLWALFFVALLWA